MQHSSESVKNDNNSGAIRGESSYPREFRNRDHTLLVLLMVGALAAVFLWAMNTPSSLSVKLMPLTPIIAIMMVLSKSKKLVFVLLPNSIEIGGDVSISYDKIQKVKLWSGYAVIVYTDSSGEEKETAIMFGDLALSKEAKPALRAWLNEHNLQSLVTEK